MDENKILVVIKEPGEPAEIEPLFENTLEAFQCRVGGNIEAVRLSTDLALIVNEEGKINNMPYNLTIAGLDLYGTVIAVGVRGEKFARVKAAYVPMVLRSILKGA